MRIRKLGLAAVVATAALPVAAAHAAAPGTTVKGVVVAREHARGALVVAAAHGGIATLRTTTLRTVGTRVTARATRLADGTYRAASVRADGAARKALLHAVVVAASPARLVLSAGGSVFAVGRGRSVAAVGAAPGDVRPGDVVDTTVTIDSQNGALQAGAVSTVGQTDLVHLEGTISSLSGGTLVLAVEEGALTTIAIPSSVSLPSTIAVGDRVEALVQVASGAYTLVTIQDDHAAAAAGAGGSSEDAQGDVEAEGSVTAVSSTSLTVQPEHGSPITFAVPAGVDVSAVQVGAHVHAKGQLQSDGSIALVGVQVQGGGGGEHGDQSSGVEAEGLVTAVSSTSLTVQPEHGAPVTFTVPSGVDVSSVQVGARVHAKGASQQDGSVLLVSVRVQGGGDHGSGSGSAGSGDSGSSSGSGSAGSGDSGSSSGSGD